MSANTEGIDKMERSEVELLPCPFCGDAEHLETDSASIEYLDVDESGDEELEQMPTEAWFVTCGACGAQGPQGDTPEEAERAWNSR